MTDLIKALTIFQSYLADENALAPPSWYQGILLVMDVKQEQVSEEDRARLKDLSFFWNDEYDCWSSFRFGSA
jgi:hypothetical protein